MRSELAVDRRSTLVLPLIRSCSLLTVSEFDLAWFSRKETPPGSLDHVTSSTSGGERRRGKSAYHVTTDPRAASSALFHRRAVSLGPERQLSEPRGKDSNAMGKDGGEEPQRMSLNELPPIIPRPETGSGKSRQSSGSNSASFGNFVTSSASRGHPPQSAAVRYSERPSLISAEDSGIVINGSESGRFTGTGRSFARTPGSASGSDHSGDEDQKALSFSGGTNNQWASENMAPPPMRSRAKTWGSDSERPSRMSSGNKLHPLYEKNGSARVKQISLSSSTLNAKSSEGVKLPNTISGRQSSYKSSFNSFGKRTQSYSNLSEASKTNNNQQQQQKVPNRTPSPAKKNNNKNSFINSNLHKVTSEQNIYYKSTTHGNYGDRRSLMTSQSGRRTRMSNASSQGFNKSVLHSKSQPNIPQAVSPTKANISRATTSKVYRKKFSIANDGKISESLVRYDASAIFGEANEKDKRIIDWLREVESEAERPDSPTIIDDEPRQTDTAIHVVYGQD